MTKPRFSRRILDSYTIALSNKTIQPGDCVLMKPAEPSKPSYVARVEKIESHHRIVNVKVYIRWYYRPEDTIGGRRQSHGAKEVFLSDHFDSQWADTIEDKCTVHSFKSYTQLDAIGNEDFFCRCEYESATGAFNPDRVDVYCKCEMPYDLDDQIQCDGCNDRNNLQCMCGFSAIIEAHAITKAKLTEAHRNVWRKTPFGLLFDAIDEGRVIAPLRLGGQTTFDLINTYRRGNGGFM